MIKRSFVSTIFFRTRASLLLGIGKRTELVRMAEMNQESSFEDPFPLIHLSSLDFTINTTTISSLPSSSLLLSPFSPNYPSLHRQIIREFRKRREAGRESIGQSAEMGIFSGREIRELDYWPRIEFISYHFDVSQGVSLLTSAQLLILVWKLNLGSTDELSRQAEDEFWHRRERDFAAGLTLKVMDDSSKAISESLCIPSISNLPLSPPRLPPPQHFVNSDSTKFQPPAAILSASPIERSRVDLPIHLPSPALHLPPIASTSKLQQTFIPSEERQTRPTMIKESRDGLGMNYEVGRGRKEEQGEKTSLKRTRSSRSRSPPKGSRSAQSRSIPLNLSKGRLNLDLNNSFYTLFIMNLPKSLLKDQLKQLILSLGAEGVGYKFTYNRVSNFECQNAYVGFTNGEEGETIRRKLNGRVLGGQTLICTDSRKATRVEDCWKYQDLEPEFAKRLSSKDAPLKSLRTVPHKDIVSYSKLSPVILRSKWQLFVSNIYAEAKFAEVKSYFESPGLCGVTLGTPSSKFGGTSCWLLFDGKLEMENAINRFEGLVYPGFIKAQGAYGSDDYLWIRRGEEICNGKKLNQESWDKRDFW